MNKKTEKYIDIVKSTSIFGGVQIFEIIITIIRTKLVSILIGPAGFGIISLLRSTIDLLGNLTGFGLRTSAVKNISHSKGLGDNKKIFQSITVLKRLVWLTGLLGSFLMLIFSSWLSNFTFSNYNYTYSFVWLSITLLLNQLSVGNFVILQGLRRIKLLAKSSLFGSFTGLLITIPIYYYYRLDGVVPVLIITSFITLLFTKYFSSKVTIEKSEISFADVLKEGKGMIKMGFAVSFSGLLVMGVAYITRIYINSLGGISQVGLYSAGFAIINTYVGLVLNAMGTDYYPKLSLVANNKKLAIKEMNQQGEILLLILGPILIIFLVFIKTFITVLYSNTFIGINDMLYWAVIGLFFKASSWVVAFLFLAKGESKLFFWNELIFNIYSLVLGLIGYHFMGLTGIGISYLISYLIYFIQVILISKINYGIEMELDFIKIFLVQFLLASLSLVVVKLLDNKLSILFGTLFVIISIYFTFIELNKRLSIVDVVKNYLQRGKK